ncbi:hypothetical protein AMJ74_05030 [candidate division WOR_3 bacterium SM1_77]|uniref:HTH cro/C1-type domain-containing protein n=1 Tax=candidate division WOR_3 bacterium SM1_77 TaxID=1703778 RepID=A0A0S8JUZ3_UNCW3|nr:MAG: hypothetical protein AMJ74_05030 [candidate division WOR_3 bacterium SM1_77]
MTARDCLSSLELLRDFVTKFVPLPVYMKNLIIDHVETPNRRLWALRESMHIDEVSFARFLGITLDEYHQYEKADSTVPKEFLQSVADEFSIPVEWLLCECPMLPIPKPKRQK